MPDDGREIDPHVLALDVAVVSEFDDMEHAELERTVLAVQTEGPAGRPAPPQRLVDHEIIAIKPSQAVDLAFGQVGERRLVEGARLVTAALVALVVAVGFSGSVPCWLSRQKRAISIPDRFPKTTRSRSEFVPSRFAPWYW